MAVFTKALSSKWTPNVGRSPNDSRETANPISTRRGENNWDSGVSREYGMTFLGQVRQPFPLLCSSVDNPVDVQIVDVVEEGQLKGVIPMEANSACRTPRGRLGNNISTSSPEFGHPRPIQLALSIHGVKISEPPQFNARHHEVLHRQSLHSILSAVSFQGQKDTYLALAVNPDSVSASQTVSGDGDGSFFSPSSPPASSDVVFASCFVFQASSSEEAATFVRDLKDVFVAAMRSKAPSRVT